MSEFFGVDASAKRRTVMPCRLDARRRTVRLFGICLLRQRVASTTVPRGCGPFAAGVVGPTVALTKGTMPFANPFVPAIRARSFGFGFAVAAALASAFALGRVTERLGHRHRAHAHWQRSQIVDHRGLAQPLCHAAPSAPPRNTAQRDIHQIGEFEYAIARRIFDAALSNPMQYAKAARIVPTLHSGRPSGFKLYAVRPGSVYQQLGLHNGDTIVAINDLDLLSAEKALTLYSTIRATSVFHVRLLRANEPITLTYRIVPD